MRFFIIHGAEGHPEENWFPWLKKELERLGHEVIVPRFPTPENQTLESWEAVFAKYEKEPGRGWGPEIGTGEPETIFIGHSLGVPFLLTVLEKRKAKAAFFVSGFTGRVDNRYNDGMTTFTYKEFDWKAIRKNCGRFYVFHSDNDPYIPVDKARELAGRLDAELVLVRGAGHFNASAGYTKFPELLERLKRMA